MGAPPSRALLRDAALRAAQLAEHGATLASFVSAARPRAGTPVPV